MVSEDHTRLEVTGFMGFNPNAFAIYQISRLGIAGFAGH